MLGFLAFLKTPKLRTYRIQRPEQERDLGPVDADPVRTRIINGTKFPGGYGYTELGIKDYWTLRHRSADLFERNLYARGLIRRLVENEVNTGLHLESTPVASILGQDEQALADWSEEVEKRFELWAQNPAICHHKECSTFGALQAEARREALVAGDVLVVMRQDQRTKLPRLELIRGDAVQTPFGRMPKGVTVKDGVELDGSGRHVAYWVRQEGKTESVRLPAYGEKSGRRLAWLLYGTDRRINEVRGTPLLGIVLQSLKELDRYRDAALRKAVINSMVALWVEKTEDKPSTRPITGGAVRRGTATTASTESEPRSFAFAEQIPGYVVEELQKGEKPTPYSNAGTDVNFREFEECVVASIAWTEGVPPEILTLAFSNNYSASQAAINEFKLHLNLARTDFGDQFCQPIYDEWLLASILAGKIAAQGYLDAFRDYAQHDTWGAWRSAEWSGHIKPAVDLTKLVNGYALMVDNGFITRDRATRELTGMKHSRVVKQLQRENPELAKANEALEALQRPAPAAPDGGRADPEEETPPEGDEEREAA